MAEIRTREVYEPGRITPSLCKRKGVCQKCTDNIEWIKDAERRAEENIKKKEATQRAV